MSVPDPIEDAIHARANAERAMPGVSFAPIYAFVSNIAHIARGQERQTILDAVTAAREPGHGEEWNAGYDAALKAVIRILVERSFTHNRRGSISALFLALMRHFNCRLTIRRQWSGYR
jgi:hypothetical protein